MENHKDYKKINKKDEKLGHAVVVTDMYIDQETNEIILQIKNSWGTGTSYQGIFYLSTNIFDCYFTDVFYYENELGSKLNKYYEKFVKDGGIYENYVMFSYSKEIPIEYYIEKWNP